MNEWKCGKCGDKGAHTHPFNPKAHLDKFTLDYIIGLLEDRGCWYAIEEIQMDLVGWDLGD